MSEISDETYEQLRQILEKQNEKLYTLDEAREIGNGLIEFFKILKKLSADSEET